MSSPRDVSLLLDIAAAAERIVAFTEGMDEETFGADARTHLAVQHQITVIGEAAKRLSPEAQGRMDELPWSAITRMRDRLIHGYDTVDLGIVWNTARQSIPRLLLTVRDRLAEGDAG
jgi:uncharacterized protein with HEPN domain